jgi:hypothetical protein
MDGIFHIGTLKGGLFGHEVSEKFAEMLQAVEHTGKAGKLTVTIDATKTTGGMVALVAKCTNKTPEPKPDADVRWVTEDGDLTHANPKQRELSLRNSADERPRPRSGTTGE